MEKCMDYSNKINNLNIKKLIWIKKYTTKRWNNDKSIYKKSIKGKVDLAI